MTDRFRFARVSLLAGTVLGAAMLATPALATGFNGTVTSATGAVVNATNDDITITGSEAVIDWNANATTSTDTSVSFLSSTGSVLYHDQVSGGGDFTVLNRITPMFNGSVPLTVPITISGSISSTVAGKTGGNVWFYSPYGIITDGTANFTVGSLLLTTSDIDQSSGSLYLSQSGTAKQIGFIKPNLGAGVPDAQVQINGSTITALGNNLSPTSAYVGIFSNRIVQGGTIASSGATALVAAQEGSLTFDLGTVSFAITTGSSDSQGIVHTGTTGGPASAGETRQIALVAMPQNQAMTMLLQGSIGYTPAASATPDGSAVILNAGYDPTLPAATLATGLGNITIAGATVSNALFADATGTIAIPSGSGTTSFLSNALLYAGKALNLSAGAGDTISVGGSLSLASLFTAAPANATITVTGTSTSSGLVSVTGGLNIDLTGSPSGFVAAPPLNGQSATGGTATVNVSNGALTVGGSWFVYTDAYAGSGTLTGGNANGGTIAVTAGTGGTISATDAYFLASASGGGASGVGSTGGDGLGGTIGITTTGGTLGFGSVNLQANGSGGEATGLTGNGLGGQIAINILGGAQSWTSLDASATATNGFDYSQGGAAYGNATARADAITLHVAGSGSSLTVGQLLFDASAYAAMGSGAAHTITGGTTSTLVDGGGALAVNGAFTVRADAAPSMELVSFSQPVGPTMTGGSVSVIADGGTITSSAPVLLSATATGIGGSAGAGIATGGNVTLGALNGGSFTLSNPDASVQLRAEALGATGPAPANAQGGHALLYAQDGTIDTGSSAVLVSATAYGGGFDFGGSGSSGDGYSATGGTATVDLRQGTLGTGKILVGDLAVTAKGDATPALYPDPVNLPTSFDGNSIRGVGGNGGTGTGGQATVNIAAGTFTTASTTIAAIGVGGSSDSIGSTSYVSGDGFGGTARFTQTGGTATTNQLLLTVVGHGGGLVATADGSALPLAGTGHGGTAIASLAGGSLTVNLGMVIDASAIGGDGFSTFDPVGPAADGGAGDASTALAQLLMPSGSTAVLKAGTIDVLARGIGGQPGSNGVGVLANGGIALGGTASYSLSDGSFDVGALTAQADAVGGGGTIGGNATGGTASFAVSDANAAQTGLLRRAASVLLNASPVGGGTPPAQGTATAGTTSFSANIADATGALNITGDLVALANGSVSPVGSGVILNLAGTPVLVGGNVLASTTRDITGTIAAGAGISATGALSLDARAIAIGGTGTLSGAVGVTVFARQSISMGGLSSGGTTIITAQDTSVPTDGPVTIGNLNSAGLVRVLGSSVTIGSTGSLHFEDAQATTGNLSLTTAGNLTLDIVGAGGALTTVSGGTLAIGGSAIGQTISMTSADIQLGPDALVGSRGYTSSVTLTNSAPAAGTYVGGTGQAGAWSLSATELQQIQADTALRIQTGSVAAAPGDVVIGPLALTYGIAGNLGAGANFTVATTGRIRVIGGVALTSGAAGDTFTLNANAIDVVGDAGQIAMLNANGGLSGQLKLQASTIRAASSAALADLDTLTSLSAISARLDKNDGTVRNGGFFQAGQITFNAASGLYIQNTGASTAYADRRGFTANAVALQTASGSTQIAINGVVVGATGALVTGLDTQHALTLNGAALTYGGAFATGSTVNGCYIGIDCNLPPVTVTPPKDIIDILPEPPGSGGAALEKLDLPIVSFGEFPSFNSPPLIDEPVTGVGNDDLWQQQCGADTDCHG